MAASVTPGVTFPPSTERVEGWVHELRYQNVGTPRDKIGRRRSWCACIFSGVKKGSTMPADTEGWYDAARYVLCPRRWPYHVKSEFTNGR